MSLNLARPLARSAAFRSLPARMMGQRLESTTAQKGADAAKNTAAKAGQVASEYQAKAAQGLSRVTSAAGPAIVGAAKGLTTALGRIGGRTGRFIKFVESMPIALCSGLGGKGELECSMADGWYRTSAVGDVLFAGWL